MSELFQLRLHVTAAGLCLDARGRLDGTTCHRLTRVITAVLDHRAARRVMLGLYAVDAIDLAGIAALRMSHAQAHRHGVELLMYGPQRHVRAAIGAAGAGHLITDTAGESMPHLPVRAFRQRDRARYACPRPPARPPGCVRPARQSAD
ncbi:hypothetical protein Cme02nite_01230 [Catellatospora methionotrophica]|uniref:STAS domain-containing protein n=1 Tax=Catellatospora methionotrophica TaxID=121620 RepID=A0A8J3PBW3_9ACTN|nr:STAS domain-containing protein [Catellatospora methionotrophica]GIG11791.1 hypothetical protein Cme02nite_01230 [Catellatospora methionotrophica]